MHALSRQRRSASNFYECMRPVKLLRHTYTLEKAGDETVVRQRMESELKFGPLGKVMDALMVRKKWDAGIKITDAWHPRRACAPT